MIKCQQPDNVSDLPEGKDARRFVWRLFCFIFKEEVTYEKRVLSLLLCLCVSASMFLYGCSGTSDTDTGSDQQSTDSASEDDTESAGQEELQKYIDQGYITVGTSNDAPISFVDPSTGEFTGFDGEIIQDACKRLGIDEVRVETMNFSDLIVALNSGHIDMICDCMMINDDRLQQCYFSDYLYQNSELLVVPEDSNIKSKDDFTGNEVIGCTTGTTFLATAQEWQKEGIIKEARAMGDQPELLLNVQTGKIDGCLTDAFVIEYMIAQNDSTVQGLKVAEDYQPEGAAGAGYACRFEDKEMMQMFNKVFAEMRAEGVINQYLEDFGLSTDLHGITQEQAEHGLNIQ